MEQTSLTLTVFFDAPFWVGVFERVEEDNLSVCKHTFGAEPTNTEVLALIQQRFRQLSFSPVVSADHKANHTNPKRRQRAARKAVETRGIGTKAQQALAAQREVEKKCTHHISAQHTRSNASRTIRQASHPAKSQTPRSLATAPQAMRLRLFSLPRLWYTTHRHI